MARQFQDIPDEVMRVARAEYQVVLNRVTELTPIRHHGKVVGFYRPHMAGNGTMRIGPIFVLPKYRRLGLVRRVYARISGPLIACVRDDNPNSIALHERAGFARWKRYAHGWWWRRP